MRPYKNVFSSLVVIAVLSTAAASSQATTWYVIAFLGNDSNAGTPFAPFRTIQHAIDTAAANDTIVVGDDTYYESLSWTNKDLTIQGLGPGSHPIIDGGLRRCLYTAGLTNASHLEGFFLRDGSDTLGAGMFNHFSSPTVTNCTFIGNSASDRGGAMYNAFSSPTITNCTFSGNSSVNSGGGMYSVASSPILTNCTFSGNSSVYFGGGMYNASSSPTIANCTFSANTAGYGGGVFDESSSPIVTSCMLWGNSAGEGGGMFNDFSSPTVTNSDFSVNGARGSGGGMYNGESSTAVANCAFTANSALSGGGMYNRGVYYLLSNTAISNCTFTGNTATWGGGMDNAESSPTVTNCTFSGNAAPVGGGTWNELNASPVMTNCILWGDSGGEILVYAGATVSVTFSDVEFGYAGAGNTNTDPMFVRNPTVVLNSGGTADPSASDFGDLRLQAASPCIDVGSSAVITAANGFLMDASNSYFIDLAGHPRIVGAGVDMGAYEFQQVNLVASAQTQALMNNVTRLVGGGASLPANGQPLYAKLDAAIAYLQAGDTADAISVLQAFINQVKAFTQTGRLASAQGQTLISQAQAIITLLGG